MPKIHLLTVFQGVFLFLCVTYNVSAISVEKYLTLTTRQKHVLGNFRQRVEPRLTSNYMKSDAYLIQWIRARNFDVNSAEKMFRENLKWRLEYGTDNLRYEDFSDMSVDYPFSIDTYDRTGRPIGVIDIGECDFRRAVVTGKVERGFRYIAHQIENITGQVYERQQLGMNVTQVVVLGDAEGFNIIQHACPRCLPFWIRFVQLIENHYPEALDELIVINAPPTVQVVLETVKPFLSRATREAIRIFGSNKVKWMEYVDKKISKEERRKQYGGTKL